MARLPFLVVHGALVWKVLLAVLVAATLAIGHAIRGALARRRARSVRDALMATVSAPRPGAIVVRGRVCDGAAFDDPSTSLVLDCDGERVVLVGAIHVEQGSTVRRDASTLVCSVRVGDEVLAAGTLAMAPAPAEPASYREAKPQWTLTSADGGPIRVLATAPRVKALPLGLAGRVGALIVAAPIWFGILHVVGSTALEHTGAAHPDGSLPELGRTELAAAMPGSRDDALNELRWQLRRLRSPATEQGLQLLLALDDLEGTCPVATLADGVQLEPALAAARRCGTHDQVVGLLAFLGRFEEAEHELAADDRSALATTLHIATGHWAAAALGADALAARLSAKPASATTQRCLAALLRTYGGDSAAFASVSARGSSRTCAILEAAAKPVPEQAAAFAAIPAAEPTDAATADFKYDLMATELHYAAGAAADDRGSLAPLSALIFLFPAAQAWLAPFQLAAHPDDARAHEAMVAYDTLVGDLVAARDELVHVDSSAQREQLDLALALREGTPIELSKKPDNYPGLDEALTLRNGTSTDVQNYMDGDAATFRNNLDRALRGDGDGLVAALQEDHLQWHAFAIPLLGVLPRITSHRDHATAALRLFRDSLTVYSTDHLPFDSLVYFTMYRDIARLAGDTEDAVRWQAITDRYVKVLGDRQKLTALLFWAE